MCLTFQIMTLEKHLTVDFERKKFRGYPHFDPAKCGVSKNYHPCTIYDPTFLFLILFYSKNMDVCKKLELNPLRFDRDIRGLGSKKKIKNFHFFAMRSENAVNQRIFNFFFKLFLYMVSNYPLILYMVQH